MIKKRFIFSFVLAFLVFLYLARASVLGAVLGPYLSGVLTRLFGMPVSIQGLKADPFTGESHADYVEFLNQPEFSPIAHFRIKGMDFVVEFKELLKKRVIIHDLVLNQPFYFIERRDRGDLPSTNVQTWIRHIKDRNKGDDDGVPTKWHVQIDRIELRNGTFIYYDLKIKDKQTKYVFEQLDGMLTGFEWRPEDPKKLTQKVRLEGTFGEHYPAPIEIKGLANFATSDVSFNLRGEVPEGDVREHKRYWEDLPIDVQGGLFDLKLHVVCELGQLSSKNILTIHHPKVAAGATIGDKLWGSPVVAGIKFLQNQETIVLRIPVSGDISDPQFDFPKAFSEAFQKSIGSKIKSGVSAIGSGTAKLAQQTQDIAMKTPGKFVAGVEKISTLMKDKTPEIEKPFIPEKHEDALNEEKINPTLSEENTEVTEDHPDLETDKGNL